VVYSVVVVNAITLRQRVTPDRLQSRVNTAGRMLSFGGGWPTGALAGGIVSEAYGPRAAIVASIGLIVVAAVVAWLSPLRGIGVESPQLKV
jgi:predicted MFS family arabinose efflux permease